MDVNGKNERNGHVGIATRRCGARHPSHPQQVRCDKDLFHVDAEHGNSFYMRLWEDLPAERLPENTWD